jgi:hypothetical protein
MSWAIDVAVGTTPASFSGTDPITAAIMNAVSSDLRTLGDNLDGNGKWITNLAALILNPGSLPGSPSAGMIAANASKQLKIYDGSAWQSVSVADWSSDVSAGGHGLTALASITGSGGNLSIAAALFVSTATTPLLRVTQTSSGATVNLAVASGGGSYVGGSVADDGILYGSGGLVLGAGSTGYVFVRSNGNIGLGTGTQFGSGVGVIAIANRGTAPTTNPTGGGLLYGESGALKWRGSSGTVTTIAPA